MTPGGSAPSPLASFAKKLGLLTANTEFITNVDRTNYSTWPESDEQGRLSLPPLVPGATCNVVVRRAGRTFTANTFRAQANDTSELGDIVVDRPD